MHDTNTNQRAADSENYQVLWGFLIQMDQVLEYKNADLMAADKINYMCSMVDVPCPFDPRIFKKEDEKIDIYNPFKYEIA